MILNRSKEEQEELQAEAELFKEGGLEALLVKKKPIDSNSAKDSTISKTVTKPQTEHKNIEKIVENANYDEKEVLESEPKQKENDNIDQHQKVESSQEVLETAPASVANDAAKSEEASGSDEEDGASTKEKKPRYLKYQNILGNKIYKEQTARGGVKWFIGEDIDEDRFSEVGIVVDDNSKKMIKLAQMAEDYLSKHLSQKRDDNREKSNKHKGDKSNTEDSEEQRGKCHKNDSRQIEHDTKGSKEDENISSSDQFIVPEATEDEPNNGNSTTINEGEEVQL
jgi:hypothetical protein